MTEDNAPRPRNLMPSLKVFNASDEEQVFLYNSVGYKFQPGETKAIEGQPDVPRDAYGRMLETSMTDAPGRHYPTKIVPNANATAQLIVDEIERSGRVKGLVPLTGDQAVDNEEIVARKKDWIRARTTEAKRIESDWRARVRAESAAGLGTPVMPEYAEKAQDFLDKYRGGMVTAGRRFVVSLDGRSFDTRAEAKKHIQKRYAKEAPNADKHINDTMEAQEDALSEAEDAVEALSELAKKVDKRSKEKL